MCKTSNNSEKNLLTFQDQILWGFKWVWVGLLTYWPPSFGSCVVGYWNLSLRWSGQDRADFLQHASKNPSFSSWETQGKWLLSPQVTSITAGDAPSHVWRLHFIEVLVFHFVTCTAAQHKRQAALQERTGQSPVPFHLLPLFLHHKNSGGSSGKGWRQVWH